MKQLGSQWINFHEIWYLYIFPKSVEKPQVSKSDENIKYFTWRPLHMYDVFRWTLIRMRNISDIFVDKIKIHILCSIIFSENRVVYKIIWKSTMKPDRTQMTIIWRMPFACWTAKTSDTHSESVIHFHCNNGCFSSNCYVKLIFPVLFIMCDIIKERVDKFWLFIMPYYSQIRHIKTIAERKLQDMPSTDFLIWLHFT